MTSGTSPIAHDGAALLAELADQLAVGGDDPQRDLRLVVGQGVERREVWARAAPARTRPSRRADDGEPAATTEAR